MSVEMFGFTMEAWQIFTSLGILFIILEAFAPGFILLPIGLACLITAGLSGVFTNWTSQMVVLAINLGVVFVVFTRYIRPKFKKDDLLTNANSMVGKEASVTVEVNPEKETGYVKLYGDRWKAVSETGETFAKGTKVIIRKLDGNKVVVSPE